MKFNQKQSDICEENLKKRVLMKTYSGFLLTWEDREVLRYLLI